MLSWALVACFYRLGDAPVFIANEAREGVYARAMLESGNFIAPVVVNHLENGEIVPDKPPLAHWLAATTAWARARLATGRPVSRLEAAERFDEWALRFPSALCACLLVWSVAVLGAAFVGERAALFAAAALLTSAQFWYQARLGRVDMALACFASIATLLAGRAVLEGRARLLVAAAAAAGLAVLAKGPLGLLLPTLACASFVFVQRWLRGTARTSGLPWRSALAVFAVIVLPWYLLAIVSSDGAILRSQLFAENLDQFTGRNGRMSAFFYLEPWLLDSLPWSLVAIAALPWVWKRREPGAMFCTAWWLAGLAFFQVAAYKRRAYLLPVLPAEALLAGWLIDQAVSKRIELAEALVARRRAFAGLWMALALAYAAVAPIRMARFAKGLSPKELIQRIDEALPAENRLAVCGLGDDRSLVLLFYFRDPQRVDVAPEGTSCARSATGYYLMSDAEWRRAGRWGEADQWNELLRGEIRGWSRRLPVIFARRCAAGEDIGVQTVSGTDPLHR